MDVNDPNTSPSNVSTEKKVCWIYLHNSCSVSKEAPEKFKWCRPMGSRKNRQGQQKIYIRLRWKETPQFFLSEGMSVSSSDFLIKSSAENGLEDPIIGYLIQTCKVLVAPLKCWTEMTVMKCRAWKVLSHIHMTSFRFNCESVLLLSTDDTWYPSSYCFACPPLYFVAVIFKAVGVGCVEKSKSLMLPGSLFWFTLSISVGKRRYLFVRGF